MQIKSILAGAAIALAATMGSASAGEMLTLSAIPAEPLTAAEMEQVQGKWSLRLDKNQSKEGFSPGQHDANSLQQVIVSDTEVLFSPDALFDIFVYDVDN